MKLVIVAGTPASGKTSVLIHTLKNLKEKKLNVAVAKIDCLYTDDNKQFDKLKIPNLVELSKDMCPDHFTIYNIDSLRNWAKKNIPIY